MDFSQVIVKLCKQTSINQLYKFTRSCLTHILLSCSFFLCFILYTVLYITYIKKCYSLPLSLPNDDTRLYSYEEHYSVVNHQIDQFLYGRIEYVKNNLFLKFYGPMASFRKVISRATELTKTNFCCKTKYFKLLRRKMK